LGDHYAHAKATEYGFSFRVFSKRAGIRSSNYLRLVIDGQRNLTPGMAAQFATGCGLSGVAADFFCDLVSYCQTKDSQARSRAFEKLNRYRRFRAVHRLAREQAEYHSTWYLPVLRELVRRADFVPDPRWIASQLRPKITRQEAARGLALLRKLGLVDEDDSGRLVQTTALVSTGLGPLGHHVYAFHHAMLERAGHALDHTPREERDVSCLTVCVSDAKLHELKERVSAFRQELLQLAELDDEPERVVQLNFQVFPLSERPKKVSKK
jgi:uncharacterized protein (TIGR02147 family)